MASFPCSRCEGRGLEEFDDGDDLERRMVVDRCYHCGGTGRVDEDLHRADLLSKVAGMIAVERIEAFRKSCDADPDGENFAFRAAENMLAPRDYFVELVYSSLDAIEREVVAKSRDDQENLIDTYLKGTRR